MTSLVVMDNDSRVTHTSNVVLDAAKHTTSSSLLLAISDLEPAVDVKAPKKDVGSAG